MNKETLKHYIESYKSNFDDVSYRELYKWKAVKCFQDLWNINAENFSEMLRASIKLTENLLKSGQYFPFKMITNYSIFCAEETREAFKNLYNENEDLYTRIFEFQRITSTINTQLYPGKLSYQDPRAILVYLALRFPERYFFYKFQMFKSLSEKLNLIYKPIKGRIENIGHYNNYCELIKHELSLDQELLQLHKNRLKEDCYIDENLNILTQDFIYAIANHLNHIEIAPELSGIASTEMQISSSDVRCLEGKISFNGKTINYIQNNIENKRIGDLGELWVMNYEIQKLINASKQKLVNKIKHVAKDNGDGTGFDILSCSEKEEQIFIEVKTTKGNKETPFFITRNELERSKLEKENYYLYRVYNFNENLNTADLLIIRGELSNICQVPTIYKIMLPST